MIRLDWLVALFMFVFMVVRHWTLLYMDLFKCNAQSVCQIRLNQGISAHDPHE